MEPREKLLWALNEGSKEVDKGCAGWLMVGWVFDIEPGIKPRDGAPLTGAIRMGGPVQGLGPVLVQMLEESEAFRNLIMETMYEFAKKHGAIHEGAKLIIELNTRKKGAT